MQKINIVCIGNLKEKYLKDACNEYQKRLSSYCKINIIEITEEKAYQGSSPNQTLSLISKEGKKILDKIPNGLKIALCVEGKMLSSEEFAAMIKSAEIYGDSVITFIIGGSDGLSEEVKSNCSEKISMSKMTMPHQLCRLFLLEQIYRAEKINNNETYHK